MTEGSEFRSADEEVVKLLEECRELRRMLTTISSQLSRIENRIKGAFPAAAKKVSEHQKAQSARISSLSSEQALAEFDQIVRLASTGATSEAESYLQRQSAADLFAVAKEVGVTFANKKPSIRAMRDGILGKVRESLLLSHHSRRE